MFKLIKGALYSLIIGIVVLGVGAWGSLSASADAIKNSSENVFTGMQIAVVGGAILIVIAGIFFITAIIRSK